MYTSANIVLGALQTCSRVQGSAWIIHKKEYNRNRIVNGGKNAGRDYKK